MNSVADQARRRQTLTDQGRCLGPSWIFVRFWGGRFYTTPMCLEYLHVYKFEMNVYSSLATFPSYRWRIMADWNPQKLMWNQPYVYDGHIPDGYSSSPRKQTMTIHKSVSLLWYQSHLQFCHDGSFCTAIIRVLLCFRRREFLYNFGVGHAPSSSAPYTFIPTSSKRKTSVEG
jgi:hypothetical protein